MKFFGLLALLWLPTAFSVANAKEDRTITKVVKLLQGMLEKSQKEGDEERVIYAKFKCYCDTSEAEKKASIKSLSEQIALLESKIAELQGDTGTLSSECADLKAKMADNKAARDEATTIRKKQQKEFEDNEADLEKAIKEMESAIEVLAEVGADQTAKGGADNKKFMAGFKASLLQEQQDSVAVALRTVSEAMSPEQRHVATAFMQAPFTGTYTSQSAAVMGIIKNMRDTFKKDLADAIKQEKDEKAAYKKFMKIKEEAFDEMKLSYKEKQKYLGDNDGELSSKKSQLEEAEKQKASDEAFLDKLLPMCEEKAKGYANRKMLRANEEAAIAEAISILNSDEAFATFAGNDATSTGGTGGSLKLIQLRSVRKHVSSDVQARSMAQHVLQRAAQDAKSTRLSKVVALLRADNPFADVLNEIDKMLDLIKEEGKQDKTNLDWCNTERDENKKSLKEKKGEILKLEDSIDKLTTTIEDPKEGLKKQIEDTEQALVKNKEAQTQETATRTEENVAYQKDVKNLVAAQSILNKGIKVLKAYYDDLEKKLAAGEALMQEDPKPPEAWKGDGAYEGQSKQGGDVMEMLNFILEESVKEEMDAHKEEEKAQADYEDSMQSLKDSEAESEKQLADLQETLAEKEQELLEAQEDLKKTTADKEAIEAYLAKIKPGCDFITKNFDLREKSRKTEKTALEKAIKLIKATPAYKTFTAESTVESYGDCKEPCVDDKDDVKCKACMADVTVPAYCAGHKGTKGC